MSKCYLGTKRYYYKYEYDTFEQPVLTENGKIGINNFVVSAFNTDSRTQPYYVFNGNTADAYTAGWLSKSANNYLEWYSKNGLNISQLKIQYQTTSASSVGFISKWNLCVSNDGINFISILNGTTGNYGITTLDIEHEGYYKYWRFYPFTWSSEWYAIIEMEITATEQKTIESTEDDYDFYLDKPIALLNKNEDNEFIAYKY